MHSDITGILLAGGKSSRMGVNKAFMKIGNETVIERTANILRSIFTNVLLSTNSTDEYSFLGLKTIPDIYKDIGPLGGIHSGLLHSETEKIFVLSCDMPLMSKEQIEYIISYPASADSSQIIVAKADGFIQQLCGIYNKSLISSIEKKYNEYSTGKNDRSKKCKVLQLLENSQTTVIDVKNEYPDYKENSFFNMNRQEDFEYIKKLFE